MNDIMPSMLPKSILTLEDCLTNRLYMFSMHGKTSVWKEKLLCIMYSAWIGYVCDVLRLLIDVVYLVISVVIMIGNVLACLYFDFYQLCICTNTSIIKCFLSHNSM